MGLGATVRSHDLSNRVRCLFIPDPEKSFSSPRHPVKATLGKMQQRDGTEGGGHRTRRRTGDDHEGHPLSRAAKTSDTTEKVAMNENRIRSVTGVSSQTAILVEINSSPHPGHFSP